MRFTEAKTAAEAEGTEKSTRFRKTARNTIIVLTTIMALIVITYSGSQHIAERQQQKKSQEQAVVVATAPIPLETVPKKDWPSQDMEPWRGGKTLLIPVAPHKLIVMEGRDFRYHCVYDGERKSSFVRGEKPCSNDGIRFVYASNETDQPNSVIYAYEAEAAELDI